MGKLPPVLEKVTQSPIDVLSVVPPVLDIITFSKHTSPIKFS